jgi:hypothetical protein|tara:strand:- start:456 stop:701 length:246 start_codon:yes stop_codon:yes gene_type:complete
VLVVVAVEHGMILVQELMVVQVVDLVYLDVVEQVIVLQQVRLKEIMVVKLDLDQTILVEVVELALWEHVVLVELVELVVLE